MQYQKHPIIIITNKSFNKYIVCNKSINDAKYQERCKKYNSEIETLKKDYSQQIKELEKKLLIAQKKGSSVQINKIKKRIQNDIKATSFNSEILNYFSNEDSNENYLAKYHQCLMLLIYIPYLPPKYI